MAVKKKYQQAPKEKKYFMIGLPFFLVGILFMIPIMIGVGLVPCLILFLLFDGIFLVFIILGMKEHKKWIAEGNPPYRYYDTETGQEVDEHGNPITGQPAPQPKPQPAPAPQSSGVDQPEPEPVFENEEPKEEQPAPQPAPQKEPETIRGADLTIFGKLLPAAGLGLLSLAFLLRTIMFIRELVPYAKAGGSFWGYYITYAIRILGPLVLLALCVVALVKFFVNKQTINQGYKAMLKIAIWYAVLNIVGLVYMLTSAGLSVYNMVDLMIRDSDNWNIYLEMLIESIIIDILYIAFAIALIIFTKIALKNNVDSMKNKVFAMLPFGIIVLTEVLFMIITGATLPEGFVAPGYFVTAVIILLGAGSLGAIPFLVRFEKEDGDGAAAVAPAAAAAPVAAAPAASEPAPVYEEPKYEQPQPQKRNDDNGPEVKSNNKKGLIIILIIIACIVLVGGGVTTAIILANKKNSGGEHNKQNESSYVAPTSRTSSSSSSKPSSSSTTYTPVKVIADIDKMNTGSATHYAYDSDTQAYYFYISYGSTWAVEDNLRGAITNLSMPDYLIADSEPYSGTWSDGDPGYFQYLHTSDNKVTVSLGSFLYSDDSGDDLRVQILAYNS